MKHDNWRETYLYSTTLTEAHDLKPIPEQDQEVHEQPFDIEHCKARAHAHNHGFLTFLGPNKRRSIAQMNARTAHFWLDVSVARQTIGREEWPGWVNQRQANMYSGRYTRDDVRALLEHLHQTLASHRYDNVLGHIVPLLSKVNAASFVYTCTREVFGLRATLVSMKVFDKEMSAQIREDLLTAIEHTTHQMYTEWGHILHALQQHGNEETITAYLKAHKGRLFNVEEAKLLERMDWPTAHRLVHQRGLIRLNRETIIAHMRAFGFERFETLLPLLPYQCETHGAFIYKIHHVEMVPLMLSICNSDHEHTRLAYRWLRDEGANAIVGLASHIEHPEWGALAEHMLTHYIKRGFSKLVTQLVNQHVADKTERVAQLVEQHASPSKTNTPSPNWFEHWQRRGVRGYATKQAILAMPPLRTVDGHRLNERTRTGLIRLFQDRNTTRGHDALHRLHEWIDEPSRRALAEHIVEQWQRETYSQRLLWAVELLPTLHLETFQGALEQCIDDLIDGLRYNLEIVATLFKATRQLHHVMRQHPHPKSLFWCLWLYNQLQINAPFTYPLRWIFKKINPDHTILKHERMEHILVNGLDEARFIDISKMYIDALNGDAQRPNIKQWRENQTHTPALLQLHSQCLWAAMAPYQPHSTVFRVDEDGSLVDIHDNPIHLPDPSYLRLAQPHDFNDVTQRLWQQHLLDHQQVLLHNPFFNDHPVA